MALIDLERRVLELCFRAQPPAALLAELGDARAWLLYREMVRERLLREIHVALPRSCALLGEAELARLFEHFLEREPPRTRFFRAVIGAFVRAVQPLVAAETARGAALSDLLSFELALWEVRDLEGPPVGPPAEFDFDRVPIVTPALRLLRVERGVHLAPAADGGYPPGPYWLCIQRQSDACPPQTLALTQTTFQLLERWQRANCSVTESVRALAAEQGWKVDAAFIEGLCAALAQFIERGIVLGSHPA
jgi:hypothetical protein